MTIGIKQPLEIEKIKDLLTKNKSLSLVLKEGAFSRGYIINLQKELPNYVVSEIKWLNKLLIVSSISTDTVLENLCAFYQCIDLFDQTAHYLMNLMATTFDVNLSNSSELYDLKRNRSKKQRGKINDEWNYHFHGKGCSFTNSITKQFLDVQIINGLEYGELETNFLMKFIQTTESLRKMSSIIDNKESNMQKVIEILRTNKYIIELPSNNVFHTLIINRNKKPDNSNL